MLTWVVTFLVLAIIAGALGFGGIASFSLGAAKIFFFVFIVLFLVSLVAHILTGRKTPMP